jgi:dihydroxyacetone kinase
MKKIMNDPLKFVDESLEGIIAANSILLKFAQDDPRAVVRTDAPVTGKVAIVTGGGYGHLPTFLGFVGKGLCDGVAVGNVFTSPSSDSIVSAAKAVHAGQGVIFLFGNYAGDTMNFEMAAEELEMEDIHSEIVKVSDDVASAPRENWNERRGVAGLFFAYKIAGAMAEKRATLDQVSAITRKVIEQTATMGIALSSCQLPAASKPIFEIGKNEMEIGMGIHGEPGVERVALKTSAEIAESIIDRLVKDLNLRSGSRVAILVNGLGATSREELYILFKDTKKILDKIGIKIEKTYVDEFATSMEMQGASITLLSVDDELVSLLEQPVYTPFIRL